jgi:hypothetical protein
LYVVVQVGCVVNFADVSPATNPVKLCVRIGTAAPKATVNTGGQAAGLLSPTTIGYLVDISKGSFNFS